jgi:hypothetical protein
VQGFHEGEEGDVVDGELLFIAVRKIAQFLEVAPVEACGGGHG